MGQVEHRPALAGLGHGVSRGSALVNGQIEVKAKLTAAWRAAIARMIEAGYNPADVHETMISVGLSGTRKPRMYYMILVGVAVMGVGALKLFSDLRENRQALVLAHSEIETLNSDRAPVREEGERLKRDLAAARSEIDALNAEGARALMTDAEAVRAAEAKGVEQQEALRREREEGERLKRDL